MEQPLPSVGTPSTFHAVPPSRVLDTRNAIGVRTRTPLAARGTLRLVLPAGRPVPTGATAVVLNVTVTRTTASGYLTVFPDGARRPASSNLNWTAGRTIPNQVVVPVGAGGALDLYNGSTGTTHVVADLAGYYTGDSSGLKFTPSPPHRILDTRAAVGVSTRTPVKPHGTVRLQVAGRGAVPRSGVTAVVLNVTVAGPTAAGYLTVYPDGMTRPAASDLNWSAGETVPNHVVVRLGADGKVDFYNGSSGTVAVVADVFGSYAAGAGGQFFHPMPPTRLLDTRGYPPVPPNVDFGISFEKSTAPPPYASAVVLNVTVTQARAAGYLVAFPGLTSPPAASNLDWTAGETVSNLVTGELGAGSITFHLHTSGSLQLVADGFGYFANT
ncbi:hypothetical protein ACFQZC_03080 [Streptacidiphilus monticola]